MRVGRVGQRVLLPDDGAEPPGRASASAAAARCRNTAGTYSPIPFTVTPRRRASAWSRGANPPSDMPCAENRPPGAVTSKADRPSEPPKRTASTISMTITSLGSV